METAFIRTTVGAIAFDGKLAHYTEPQGALLAITAPQGLPCRCTISALLVPVAPYNPLVAYRPVTQCFPAGLFLFIYLIW